MALLADGLVERGHDVTLFAPTGSHTGARLVSPLGPPLGTENVDPGMEACQALAAYWRAQDFDVIHDHTELGAAIGTVFDGGPPVVHTLHLPWAPPALKSRRYEILADRLHLVAISESQRDGNPNVEYAGVVHNAIDPNAYPFREDKEDFLLFLGRSNPEKGPEFAVEVAKRVGMHLKMLVKRADPPQKEHWDRVVAPRLTGDEEIFGEVSHEMKVDILSRARATLFPIQWPEPFGLVMIESMACGTPAIAFSLGAAAEVIADGVTGFLCEQVDEMVEAVRRVDEISPEACRRRVVGHFSADVMVAGYERIFEQVANRSLEETVFAP